MKTNQILVIKHGAFGDMITATGAFSAIRRHHLQDQITLLTGPRFEELAQNMGYFNEIIVDKRSNNPLELYKLWQFLKNKQFTRVYDLQNSTRTALYYKLMGLYKRPEWSGIAAGCSHPQKRPDRELLPASQRLTDQLRIAGLQLNEDHELLPDISWMQADIQKYDLPEEYILLVPGSSAKGVIKRWPVEKYIELAHWFFEQDILPVIIAGPDEQELVEKMLQAVPSIRDLSQKISFMEMAALGRNALAVIGNDTGPVHLIAATGCLTILPWSCFSEPEIYAPRGSHVSIVYEADLKNLSSERVQEAFRKSLSNSSKSEYNRD